MIRWWDLEQGVPTTVHPSGLRLVHMDHPSGAGEHWGFFHRFAEVTDREWDPPTNKHHYVAKVVAIIELLDGTMTFFEYAHHDLTFFDQWSQTDVGKAELKKLELEKEKRLRQW